MARFRAVPMGWSHSVVIAQEIGHDTLFQEAGLNPRDLVKAGMSRQVGACRFGVYVDDFFIFGTSRKKVLKTYDRIYSALERRNLPPKPKKCQRPVQDTVTVLGIEISPSGSIEPAREKLQEIIAATRSFVQAPVWNVARLQYLLGCWNWFMLLARPAMAVLRVCYELAASTRLGVFATRQAKHELRMLIALSPLFHATMKRPNSDVMLCSDASMDGGASLYAPFSLWHVNQDSLLHHVDRTVSSDDRPPDAKWKLIHKQRWKFKKHINVLEGRAILTGVRWLARQQQKLGVFVSTITDSQVLYYLMAKGRSNAPRLWRFGQKMGALLLACNMRILPIWVASEHNPADAPSRSV
ncbi:MAG: hypothetical protein AAF438_09040 [Pseudomonadota bacterium]